MKQYTKRRRRKLRKTRRKNKIGAGKPAKAGQSMCVWYGANNKPSAVDRCDNLMMIGPDSNTFKKVYPVAIKKNWLGVPSLDESFKLSIPTTSMGNKLPGIYESLVPFDNNVKTGTYDAYYILYESKCAHGGERFELMKLGNVNIQNRGMGNGHMIKFNLWNDDMMVNQNGNTINIKWGSSKYNRPVGTIWIKQLSAGPERRNTIGGRKRRKKRTRKRKKSKKRRRRKSRKRTRKSKKKKRKGGNEPDQNWPEDPIDLCKKKYNDVNYRFLTNQQADRYCKIHTGSQSAKCIDGECKFVENSRSRYDPSSIYDDNMALQRDRLELLRERLEQQ